MLNFVRTDKFVYPFYEEISAEQEVKTTVKENKDLYDNCLPRTILNSDIVYFYDPCKKDWLRYLMDVEHFSLVESEWL